MPRGIPKAGFRRRKNGKIVHVKGSASAAQSAIIPLAVETPETDQQIEARLAERFDVLAELTDCAITGLTRAVIVSGPAGLGKSFTIEVALKQWDPDQKNHTIIKGYVRPTGLYRTLYDYRHHGQVIVFDDADSVFDDVTALNMLKAVCDTTETRTVSYLAETELVSAAEGDIIPRSFTFNGTIIFISNMDFDAEIDRGTKYAVHLNAMMSRAHYVDLTMRTRRDYMVRIHQVIRQGMLRQRGLSAQAEADVVNFLNENKDVLRELSLRIAIKVADLRKARPDTWLRTAKTTCLRAVNL